MRILNIDYPGSHQNPFWSPDGKRIGLTSWRKGYNEGPADVLICDIEARHIVAVIADGATNVTEPGSSWRGDRILYSSDKGRDGDWPKYFDEQALQGAYLPDRPGMMGYEPSFNKDGTAVVFEQHRNGDERNGKIVTIGARGTFDEITTKGDCRQPNWSPDGKWIVYQVHQSDGIHLELHDVAARMTHTLETDGEATDATFSPDSKEILYSGEFDGYDAALIAIPILGGKPRLIFGQRGRYAGAASWSPDGKQVAFETCEGDPDGSKAGTKIAVADVP